MSFVAVRVVVLVVLVALGGATGLVGLLGWRGRLARGGRFGVRTPKAVRSDEAYLLANRVAGPPAVVAGLVGLAGGVVALLVPTLPAVLVVAVIGLLGTVFIARAGAALGDRAAHGVPAPVVAGGCGGCACGSAGCAAAS